MRSRPVCSQGESWGLPRGHCTDLPALLPAGRPPVLQVQKNADVTRAGGSADSCSALTSSSFFLLANEGDHHPKSKRP